ncbi:MAG: ATP-dependent zinc metalloprotease FtsH [Gemmataceae bacterium]|nr:ATP-dependent zinc metalloprotease FtsH [Gemmataceae bacterium]MCI0740593.1 ATP-dependent zinc metalloprotease FtsH [Gemmataceae bacterium]
MQKKGKERKPLLTSTPMLLVSLAAVSFLFWFFSRDNQVKNVTYGELMQMLAANDPSVRFQNVSVRRNNELRGEMVITEAVSDGKTTAGVAVETRQFRTRIGLGGDEELVKHLDARVKDYQIEEDDSPLRGVYSLLLSFIMIMAVVVAGFFLFRWLAGGSGPFSFGRSRHKLYAQKDMKITFQDVAGIDEAVEELREIVDFLKNPEKYQALGGRIPKGVLLVGPPGTGKTLLAKAVAGEADVPFFSLSGSDFVEMFVGVGASRVRDLFDTAENRAPCIIFIDELDALGKTRGVSAIGGHDEREQTLNALLVEMDGFDSNRGVIIMSATNRPETLDPALLRPGRFDRTVVVDRPDIQGREAILKVHVRNVKLSDNVDLRHVAGLTPGTVGADLANLVNEAALLAARNSKTSVTMAEFNEAVERGAMGLERKSRIIRPEEKMRIAYHEAGHALVACSLPNTDPVHKVTIIPRGPGYLGYVWQRPEDDRFMQTKGELESIIKICMGGTLAEELVYGEIANGATSDLNHANHIARRMVKEFGMSRLGRIFYREQSENPFLPGGYVEPDSNYSEQTAREIDLEVHKIIDDAADEVRVIIEARREGLEALAKRLVEKEVIDGSEVRTILESHYPGPQLVPGSRAIFVEKELDKPEEKKREGAV